MTRMVIAVLSVVGVSMMSPAVMRAQPAAAKAVTAAGTVKSVTTEYLTIASGDTVKFGTLDAAWRLAQLQKSGGRFAVRVAEGF